MHKNLSIKSIDLLPRAADEEAGMPAFRVVGVWSGQAFESEIAVELDGRDVDMRHVSGVDLENPDCDDLIDAIQDILEAISETPAYKAESVAYGL